MCSGTSPTRDCGRKYWIAWEEGAFGATKPENPITEPNQFCEGDYVIPTVRITSSPGEGLGDKVASALSAVGITEERVAAWLGGECGCAERRAKLNRLGAWATSFFTGTPTEQIETMINDNA